MTISCQWNNRGNYPVPIDTMKSVVQVAELPQTLKFGPIEPSEMLQLAEHVIDGAYFEQFPFIEFDGFELEPKTESSLRAHFVLPNERTYLIRWTLVKRSQKRGEGVFCWTKEIVWHPDLEDSSKKA